MVVVVGCVWCIAVDREEMIARGVWSSRAGGNINKPNACYDYLATAAHFAFIHWQQCEGANQHDFTKTVALVYYIDPEKRTRGEGQWGRGRGEAP